MSKIKKIIKGLIPSSVFHVLKGTEKNASYFSGQFDQWSLAADQCSGYADDSILEKVLSAILKVKNGEVQGERDSFVFEEIQYSWPLLASLLKAFHEYKTGKVHVVDFGGSLGSSYFQNRKFLSDLAYQWTVIEQKHFVDVGKDKIAENELVFHYSVKDALNDAPIDIVVSSSTLQYIENYDQIIFDLLNTMPNYLILDRMPISRNGKEYITIQNVPSKIYSANYPCRIFSEKSLVSLIEAKGYALIESFHSMVDSRNDICHFKGYFFQKSKLK